METRTWTFPHLSAGDLPRCVALPAVNFVPPAGPRPFSCVLFSSWAWAVPCPMPASWIHPCSLWMQPTGCFDLAQSQHPQACDLGTVCSLGRVGYSSKASLEVPLPALGRVRAGRAPSFAVRATGEPQPWRKFPGPVAGQGGAGTGTALMVPSCFSSPRLEGKVDFGIWSPLLYPRLLFTPALPLLLHWSGRKPWSPTSSTRASCPQAAGSAAPSIKHL